MNASDLGAPPRHCTVRLTVHCIIIECIASSAFQALRLEQLDLTFKAIASGVEEIETIERQVHGEMTSLQCACTCFTLMITAHCGCLQVHSSNELPAAIKEQVGWNLRKMKVDVSRLKGSALDPMQRLAVEKALELRFSVLLSPAFWQQAVDRGLLA